jgi:hypothetical protein
MFSMVANVILTYLDAMIYLNSGTSNGFSENVCLFQIK